MTAPAVPLPRLLRSRGWAAAAVLSAALLLALLPVAPRFWLTTLLPLLQPHVTLWYVGAGGVVAAALLLWARKAPAGGRRRAVGAVLLVLAGYLALLFGMYRGEPPAKKFHLLQYGLLAGVVLQAVRVDPRAPAGLAAAGAFLLAVGTADEVAQGFIPMRTFRWLDLFGNYLGAALGAAAWVGASPHSPWRRRREEP